MPFSKTLKIVEKGEISRMTEKLWIFVWENSVIS